MNALQVKDVRQAIDTLQESMQANPQCISNFDEYTFHHFGDGTYVREIRLPKDTIVIGKAHKMTEVCVLSKGVILVTAEGGAKGVIYEAPYIFTAAPGKKVLFVLETAVFLNIHPNPTNTTDLVELEKQLIDSESNLIEVQS